MTTTHHTFIRSYQNTEVTILVLRRRNLWGYEARIADENNALKISEELFATQEEALDAGLNFSKQEILNRKIYDK